MLFSILVIIAVVATAFYVIKYFLNMNKCNEIGYFLDSFQKKVDSAWNSGDVKDAFEGSLPNSVEAVCFGNSSAAPATNGQDKTMYRELENFIRTKTDKNLFLYPLSSSCASNLQYYNLKHTVPASGQFFCIENVKGKVRVNLYKTTSDALVKLSKV